MHGTLLLALLACGSPAPEPEPPKIEAPKPEQKNCRAFDVIQGGVKRRLLVDENGMPCETAADRLRKRLDRCSELLEEGFVQGFRRSLEDVPTTGVDTWEKQKSDELTRAGCPVSEAP